MTSQEEGLDLAAAGATEIEIAEPAISSRPREVRLAAEALHRVTDRLEGRARTWSYIGYGDLTPVIDEILNLPVDGLLLEMTNSNLEWVDALARLPRGKLLGAGVFDVHTASVESADDIRSRVQRLLKVVLTSCGS